MNETPNGTHDAGPNSSPQSERPPYAGSEWRRPDAPATPPHVSRAHEASDGHAVGPEFTQGAQPGQHATAPVGGQQGTAPYGPPQHGATSYGGYSSGPPPANGANWPYATPEPRKPRAGRRLVAVGALTAVLGGLAGGGLVAALDSDDPAAAAGITVQGSSAPAAANQSGSVEAAAATAMKSVVTLSVRGQQEAGTGSGVVIRADGYILTNEHVTAVADGGGSITVAFADGRTATAKLVGADKKTDLAVVKVNLTGLTAATFADSSAIKVGQTVVAVGSPLGLNGTVTEGIVSALHRPTSGGSDNSAVIDAIQTDAAINPGNSGGALVDLAGRVVGINQSIATAGSNSGGFGQQGGSGNIGIGFAIPSDTAARVAQQLISTGKATHALLGVQTQTATSDDQVTAVGATIASVTPGEAAAAAGIKAGDVVLKVDDRVIGQSEDLAATIRSYAPGTKVTLTVKRDNDTRTVTVTLGSDAGR